MFQVWPLGTLWVISCVLLICLHLFWGVGVGRTSMLLLSRTTRYPRDHLTYFLPQPWEPTTFQRTLVPLIREFPIRNRDVGTRCVHCH